MHILFAIVFIFLSITECILLGFDPVAHAPSSAWWSDTHLLSLSQEEAHLTGVPGGLLATAVLVPGCSGRAG